MVDSFKKHTWGRFCVAAVSMKVAVKISFFSSLGSLQDFH
jgi:hypothetical protein